MPDPTRRLRHGDMLRALDGIDLLDAVARELIRRAGGAERSPTGLPTGVAVSVGTTQVEDPDTGQVCLLPTPSLHMISLAALAILAARELLAPGVVTATVFGTGPAARLHLSLIARYLPNVSHATVHPAVLEVEAPVGRSMRDELERAGTTLSTGADPRQAALGANLLMIAELGWGRLDIGHPHPGVAIINATRRDLPDELLADVDRVYVDDLGLLEHNQHRKFVRLHQAGSGEAPDPIHRSREGWHRRRAPWRHQRRIDADLGHVLTGARRRADVDDVILVELLNGGSLDVWLAGHIYRAAIARGLDL